MVGASKILTVSYGTFSCTLEGFEEPFSTMKAIAEYFRDLAAGDRYFGAVPPTPDAEMLHRIAEREIKRRVEAKISENGIVLRAEEAEAPQRAVTAPLAEPYAPAPQADTARPEFAAPAATVAAATVAAAAPAEALIAEALAAEAAGEDETADGDIAADTVAGDDLPLAATAPEPVAAVDAPSVEPAADDDSIAAKLMRIRAVVAEARAMPAQGFGPADDSAATYEDEGDSTDFAPSTAIGTDDFGFELDLADSLPQTARPAAPLVEDAPALVLMADEAADEAIAEEVAEDPVANEVAPLHAEAEEAFDDEDWDSEEGDGEEGDGEESLGDDWDDEAWDDEEGDDEGRAATDDDRVMAIADTGHDADDTDTAAAPAEVSDADDSALMAQLAGLGIGQDDGTMPDEPAADAETVVPAAVDEAEAEAEIAARAATEAEEDSAGDDSAEAAEQPGFIQRARARVLRLGKAVVAGQAVTQPAEETAEEDRSAEILAALTAEPASEADTGSDTGSGEAVEDYEGIEDSVAESIDDDEAEERDEVEAELAEFEAEAEAEVAAAPEVDSAEEEEAGSAADDDFVETEDDAAFLSNLARIEREAAERRDGPEGRAILEQTDRDSEASVSRLMDEAKSKLEGDENRRRFSAIAHLKAAVAATVADRKMKPQDDPSGAPTETEAEIERYRDDLSKAVRPRRPAAEGAATTRRPTVEMRPAPLMLVSEQRVDQPEGGRHDSAVIRPRRITAGNLAHGADDGDLDDDGTEALSPEEAKSFAEFAERLGAESLPELLEAAAAYTAAVEGRPHFSRPHLMRKIANVADDGDFSREDGLRSFGMLLRQGKIQKIRRGQFTIADGSKFMTEARRAAR